MQNEFLNTLRGELDNVDRELVTLLGKRLDICRQIAVIKRERGIPMMQPERIEYVKERVTILAGDCRIDPQLVSAIYDKIIQAACNLESHIISEGITWLNGDRSD